MMLARSAILDTLTGWLVRVVPTHKVLSPDTARFWFATYWFRSLKRSAQDSRRSSFATSTQKRLHSRWTATWRTVLFTPR